jgi:hypothetical protein
MNRKVGIAIAAGGLALASSASARAQEEQGSFARQPVRAPRSAFEIGVTPGYTQGFGRIAGETRRIQETSDAGFGAALSLGYRASPHWHIGWTGQFQEFGANPSLPGNTAVRGLLTGVDATFHTMPYERVDPWVEYGAGYRMMWIAPANEAATLYHGLELARLQAGVDFRVSPDVAIGPMLGADLDMFLYEVPGGPEPSVALAAKRVSTMTGHIAA